MKNKVHNTQKNAVKNSVVFTAGAIGTNAVLVLTIPFFTKVLSVEAYGVLSLYTMWGNIVLYLMSLGLHGTILNAYMDYGKSKINEYISSLLVLPILLLGVFLVAFIIGGNAISSFTLIDQKYLVILVFQSFFAFCIQMLTAKLIAEQKAVSYILITFANVGIPIVLSLLLLYVVDVFDPLTSRIYGMAFPVINLGAIILIYLLAKGRAVKVSYWKYALPISIPIIFHTLANVLLNQSDRYMLGLFTTEEVVGNYSLAYNIGSIVTTICSATNHVWLPLYYRKTEEKSFESLLPLFKSYTHIFTLIILGLLFVCPEIVWILGSQKYGQVKNIAPFLIASGYFIYLYNFPCGHEFYRKKTKLIAISTVMTCVINIGLNIIFIHFWKAVGAALATCISHALLFCFHNVVAHKQFEDYQIPRRYLYGLMLFMAGMVCLYFIVQKYILIRWGIALGCGILLIRIVVNFVKASSS